MFLLKKKISLPFLKIRIVFRHIEVNGFGNLEFVDERFSGLTLWGFVTYTWVFCFRSNFLEWEVSVEEGPKRGSGSEGVSRDGTEVARGADIFRP